jgi:glycosyltransferase involved in cell wall biosynthesis/GT2 family glycosyltransferase
MRILILNWKDCFGRSAGGAELYVRRLAEEWTLRGHRVTVLTPPAVQRCEGQFAGDVETVHVGNGRSVFRKARGYLRAHGTEFDLVVESISTRPFGAHRIVPPPVIALHHQVADDVWDREFRFPVSWLGRHVLEPGWLRPMRTARVVAVSASTAGDLSRYGVRTIGLVPPGCDIPLTSHVQHGGKPQRLIFLGRLVKAKRPGEAIRAFELIQARLPQTTLDVVGDGYLRAPLERAAPNGVTFHGHVASEVKLALLQTADIMLLPATREGWGIVAMEAARCGVPVVAYNVAGLRDSIVDGETGLLCAANPAAMAQAAVDLLADEGRWQGISRATQERSRNFTWERTAMQLLSYAETAGSATASRAAQADCIGASAQPSVAVVIPTYRRPEDVARLLAGLAGGSRVPDEVVVVDNDSSGTDHFQAPAGLNVRTLRAGLGLNLAGARNRGWQDTTSDLCVFIDDDNEVARDTIEELALAASANPQIGLLGPVILERARPKLVWCAGTRRSMWTTRTYFMHRGEECTSLANMWPTDDMPDALAIPMHVLHATGGFDELTFPFHYDEGDVACRIRALGYRTVVVGSARVWHAGGVMTDPGMEMIRAWQLNGSRRVRLMVRARVLFHSRHSRGPQRLVALSVGIPTYVAIVAAACLRCRRVLLRVRVATICAIFAGAADGYRSCV